MPFSIHTIASDEHRALVVEELIQNGLSPIMTQRAFRIRFSAFPVMVSQYPSGTSPTATPQPEV
jgi:hypothetical protein